MQFVDFLNHDGSQEITIAVHNVSVVCRDEKNTDKTAIYMVGDEEPLRFHHQQETGQ